MSDQQIELAVSGLQTDPGPFSAAPGGALIEAENVSFRRPGVIEPRGPFVYTLDATDTTQSPISIFEWQGDVYSILDDNTIRKNASSTIGSGPTSFTKGQTWSAISQDHVIFTSDNGSYAIDSSTSTDARRTGSPRAMGFAVNCGNNGVLAGVNWLKNGYSTAYRIVYVRFQATRPLLGAPSETRRVRNNSGSDVYVALTAYLDVADSPAVGDVIEIYRALKVTPYTADSADEMRLRTSITLTSGDISSGLVQFTDVLDDDAWSGESLYTNESQDGLALSNYRPYQSSDVAYYNNMAFYGRANTPHRVSVNVKAIGTPLGATAPSEWSQTLTSMDVTINVASVAQLSAIAPAAFRTNGAKQGSIVVGQVITLTAASGGVPGTADAVFQANTKITSFNPTTGNMTWDKGTLSAPGAGTVVTVWDWIGTQVGVSPIKRIFAATGVSTPSPPGSTVYDELWGTSDGITGLPLGTGQGGGACDMERAWAATFKSSGIRLYTNETNQGAYLGVQLTFERDAIGAVGFTMYSTKPLAFDRYCDTVTGIASAIEGGDNTIVWSKYQEPEAIPLPYFKQLGPSDNVIQRLAVLKDTLFVFTTHGLYRFFGTDPESLIVDLFDPTIRLVDPRMLARSHNVLWAWTTRGVMQITAGGAERIDLPIARNLDDSRILSNGFPGANWFMMASDALDIVVLGSDNSGTSNGIAYAWNGYVFDVKTSNWAWWNGRRALTAATFTTDTAIIPYFGLLGGYAQYEFLVLQLQSANSFADHVNNHITVDTVVGTAVTLSLNDYWSVAVGDVISDGTGSYWVTDVSDNLNFSVDRNGLQTGNHIVGENCLRRVVWIGNAAQDPMVDKSFIKATQPFERVKFGRNMTFVFSGFQNSTEYSTTTEYAPTGTEYATEKPMIRLNHVPHQVGRDWALKAGFMQSEAGTYWATAGLRLLTRYTSDKVARG